MSPAKARAILHLPPEFTAGDLIAAVRAKRTTAHPDKPGGSHDAFLLVEEARKCLETRLELDALFSAPDAPECQICNGREYFYFGKTKVKCQCSQEKA